MRRARQVLLRRQGLGQRRQALQVGAQAKVSTASEHDTTYFEDVLDPANTNRTILADQGDVARATLHLNWKVAAYNLPRLVYLKEAGVEAF
jgi:hypothetical protein